MSPLFLTSLTKEQVLSVNLLVAVCAEEDGVRISAETERDEGFSCFFLLVPDEPGKAAKAFLSCMMMQEGDQVLPNATVTLHVRPDLRRSGMAAALFSLMRKRCAGLCPAPSLTISCYTAPKTAGEQAAKAFGFQVVASHLLMSLSLKNQPQKNQRSGPKIEQVSGKTSGQTSFFRHLLDNKKDAGSVSLRACSDRRLLSSLYQCIFGASASSADAVAEEVMHLPEAVSYVFYQKKQPVGLCMILLYRESAYLFNVGIIPEKRGHHLASKMLTDLLPLLPSSVKTLMLEVDRDNMTALHLYESFGFTTSTELLEETASLPNDLSE